MLWFFFRYYSCHQCLGLSISPSPLTITKIYLNFLIPFFTEAGIVPKPAGLLSEISNLHWSCSGMFCSRCCLVCLFVTHPVQQLSLFYLLLSSFLSFTLCHRGFPTGLWRCCREHSGHKPPQGFVIYLYTVPFPPQALCPALLVLKPAWGFNSVERGGSHCSQPQAQHSYLGRALEGSVTLF